MKYSKILVPVVEGSNKEALNIACELSKAANGQIYILNVISVSRDKALDSDMTDEIEKAENLLGELEDYCRNLGAPDVRTELLQAREAGSAIVEDSVDKAVDLIVLSLEHKLKFGEFTFGDVMPYVMQHAPCPVLLYHNVHTHEEREAFKSCECFDDSRDFRREAF